MDTLSSGNQTNWQSSFLQLSKNVFQPKFFYNSIAKSRRDIPPAFQVLFLYLILIVQIDLFSIFQSIKIAIESGDVGHAGVEPRLAIDGYRSLAVTNVMELYNQRSYILVK